MTVGKPRASGEKKILIDDGLDIGRGSVEHKSLSVGNSFGQEPRLAALESLSQFLVLNILDRLN